MKVFSYWRQLIGFVLATCIITYGECRKKVKPFRSAKAPAGKHIGSPRSCARSWRRCILLILDKSMDVQFTHAATSPSFSLFPTETIREYEEVTLNVIHRSSHDVRLPNRHAGAKHLQKVKSFVNDYLYLCMYSLHIIICSKGVHLKDGGSTCRQYSHILILVKSCVLQPIILQCHV